MPAFAASATQNVEPAATRITTVVHADEKTGRLVRSVVVEPRAIEPRAVNSRSAEPISEGSDSSRTGFIEMVDRIAVEHGVESSLVHSVIQAESNYQPRAVSLKGALGMMQLIPATARRFGVGNVFDPEENVQGGVRYLRFLLDYYDGDYVRAIAAFNAGEAAVDKYHGIPPFPETRNYVYQVAKNLKIARQRKASVTPKPEGSLKVVDTKRQGETYRPIQASVGSDGRIYYRTP